MSELSQSLEKEVLHKNQIYGCFPTPISTYEVPEHKQLKQEILKWMSKQDINPDHQRKMISHNVVEIGKSNELLNDCPNVKQTLLNLINTHNDNTNCYSVRYDIVESYLELASEQAIYAPHEHANAFYSATYFINFDSKIHSSLKFRRHIFSTFYPSLQIPISKQTPYNMPEVHVPHSEGDLLIYPSNITHGYESNPQGERITLSMNIAPV